MKGFFRRCKGMSAEIVEEGRRAIDWMVCHYSSNFLQGKMQIFYPLAKHMSAFVWPTGKLQSNSVKERLGSFCSINPQDHYRIPLF